MNVDWRECDTLRMGAGHGVDFFAGNRRSEQDLVAVIEGFDWLSAAAERVTVSIRPADTTFDDEFLGSARRAIEQWLLSPHMLGDHEDPSPEIMAFVNG